MNVIDISKHQSTFAASTAKAAGVDGVILRHAYGTTPDTKVTGWAPDVAANGLTAEKLMYGQQVLGITGTCTLQAGYSYRYTYNYDSKALAGSIFKKSSSGKLAFAKSVSDLPMVIVGGGGVICYV